MKTLSRLLPLLFFFIVGCTNPAVKPETLEQKAFLAYGTFVVLEEQAAKVYADEAVPPDIKAAIQAADSAAKPAADAMLEAALALEAMRAAGGEPWPAPELAEKNLQEAMTKALLAIANLRLAIMKGTQ